MFKRITAVSAGLVFAVAVLLGANAVNRYVGYGGAAPRQHIVADTDAAKPAGSQIGDTVFCKDTFYTYTWTGTAWAAPGMARADLQLVLTNTTTITSNPYGGTRAYINGEIVTITGLTCLTSANVISATGTDSGAAAAASTHYYVYRSNSSASYAPGTVKNCATAPSTYLGNLYLAATGNGANWLYVGDCYTNAATQYTYVVSHYNYCDPATTDLTLRPTTSSTTGVIYKGADRFIHNFALAGTDGFNTFVGVNAGNFTMTGSTGTQGSYNSVGAGVSALQSNTTGYFNSVGAGVYALRANTTGYNNSVGAGVSALYANTTGYNNSVGAGVYALYSNTTGANNSVGAGASALCLNTTGYNNSVGAGYEALYANTTGANNSVGAGYRALYALRPTSLAVSAIADYSGTVAGTVKATSVGHGLPAGPTAGIGVYGTTTYNGTYTITYIDADNFYFTHAWGATSTGWWGKDAEGKNNTATGYQAGRTLVTGDSCTFLGYSAGYHASQLASASNSMALGNGAYTTQSNQIAYGNAAITLNSFNGVMACATDTLRLTTAKTPATSGAAGTQGDICWDANYVYVCIATNSWKRAAIAAGW